MQMGTYRHTEKALLVSKTNVNNILNAGRENFSEIHL